MDSLLGVCGGSFEYEVICKICNEFMVVWDGLKFKDSEWVFVFVVMNRFYDFDDVVIRRMLRRYVCWFNWLLKDLWGLILVLVMFF